jgi:hypothetical protein
MRVFLVFCDGEENQEFEQEMQLLFRLKHGNLQGIYTTVDTCSFYMLSFTRKEPKFMF